MTVLSLIIPGIFTQKWQLILCIKQISQSRLLVQMMRTTMPCHHLQLSLPSLSLTSPYQYSTLPLCNNTRSQYMFRELIRQVHPQHLQLALQFPTVLLRLVPLSQHGDLRGSGNQTLCLAVISGT